MFLFKEMQEHVRRRFAETDTASRERELEAAFGDAYREMISQELWLAENWETAVLWTWMDHILRPELKQFEVEG